MLTTGQDEAVTPATQHGGRLTQELEGRVANHLRGGGKKLPIPKRQ